MKISRTAAALLLAAAGLLLAPSPTQAVTPSAAPSPAAVSAGRASSAGPFNPAPVLVLGGALLAAALAWFVRPVRAATARIAARRTNR